ncbi:TerC/Alx family metal homeostasis membrane protein [Ilyomonas limi]|uniref:TerC/Alx family metal homeostasis membrane protein n=1 Tax=Ilyomonas limi TaxID=2575867 RepID=A0A4U3L1G3_9BACT|nr:TerC/Alx family metal homeostasis membrane protein [Ilyomonas limi]TKK68044.1 TerC/Alx family metal homeostasis membrane protein [Ilyomonas limi]
MDRTEIIYLVFGIALLLALVFDLGIISKKNTTITVRKALLQTIFWVGLSLAFWAFIWIEKDAVVATKYISAYLMEWSLSIDNVFVFILIFSFFKIHEQDIARALLIGVLLAIFLRIIFIAVGIGIINQFHWVLYIFGVFLLYTGIKLFFQKHDEEYKPQESGLYKLMTKVFRVTHVYYPGKYIIKTNGKAFFTTLSLVVLMLAGTDILFALDSIPTVVSLVRERADVPFQPDDIMVIYSSNIFAVLGLRSLFFMLRGAANEFKYLQQGIAAVLVFIGVKMLIESYVHISIYISLAVIVVCIATSIVYSKIKRTQKQHKKKF